MKPRPYQTRDIERICHTWNRGIRSILYVLATGGGKTFTFSQVAIAFANAGFKVLILACKVDLVHQTAEKVRLSGAEPGIIQGNSEIYPDRQIQVASVKSLIQGNRFIPEADLVIFDEAHHLPARTCRMLWEIYPNVLKLAVTATPIFAEGINPSELFDEIIIGEDTFSLIQQGFLSPYRLVTSPPDAKEKVIGDFPKTWNEYFPGALTLVFCPSIQASQAIAEVYNAANIPTLHMDGKTYNRLSTDEKKEVIANLKNRKYLVITNCNMFGEGTDIPELEVVQNIRSIKSLTLWLQIAGRLLRPYKGITKTLCDHTNTYWRLGAPDEQRDWNEYFLGKSKKRSRQSSSRNYQPSEEEFDSDSSLDEPLYELYEEYVDDNTNNFYNPNVSLIELDARIQNKHLIDKLRYNQIKSKKIPDWIVYRLEETPVIKRLTFGDWRYLATLLNKPIEWAYYMATEQRNKIAS